MVKSNLCTAIKNFRRVSIIYDKQVRVVDPYLVGTNKKGSEALRAYQVGGYSSSGNLPAWRLYLLKNIDSVEILDTSFKIHPQYNPNDKDMVQISCRVEKM
ncbi:MAG: hypothetical protein WC117_08905 [Sphaerochaetaceae bacterium]|jgi:hypothetical protein|nr:MAG: hypothetical protein CVV35_07680 [Methanomicrobiales archaeon HGW-Methanomicrobiales-6]